MNWRAQEWKCIQVDMIKFWTVSNGSAGAGTADVEAALQRMLKSDSHNMPCH